MRHRRVTHVDITRWQLLQHLLHLGLFRIGDAEHRQTSIDRAQHQTLAVFRALDGRQLRLHLVVGDHLRVVGAEDAQCFLAAVIIKHVLVAISEHTNNGKHAFCDFRDERLHRRSLLELHQVEPASAKEKIINQELDHVRTNNSPGWRV